MKSCYAGASIIALTLALGPASAAASVELAPSRAVYTTTLSKAKPERHRRRDGTMTLATARPAMPGRTEEHDQLTVRYLEGRRHDGHELRRLGGEGWLALPLLAARRRNGGRTHDDVSGEARLDGPAGRHRRFHPAQADQHRPAARRALSDRPHDPADRARGVRRGVRRGEGARRHQRRGRGRRLGGDRRAASDRCRRRRRGQEPAAGAAVLARPSRLLPGRFACDHPDYEVDMRLLDNGVARDMVLDYGDFAIKTSLNKIEALPKPKC